MMTIPQELTYKIMNNRAIVYKDLMREVLQRTTKGLAGDIELDGFEEGRYLGEERDVPIFLSIGYSTFGSEVFCKARGNSPAFVIFYGYSASIQMLLQRKNFLSRP